MYLQIRAQRFQLRFASQAAGAYSCGVRQFLNRGIFLGTERVARIFALRDGSNLKLLGEFSWEIFKTMDCQVDAAVSEGFFNLFGEHSFCADFCEGDVGDFVTSGVDDLNFYLVAVFAETSRNVIGLPERQLGTARTDTQPQPSAPGPRVGLGISRGADCYCCCTFCLQLK